jgi:hypothetical protein
MPDKGGDGSRYIDVIALKLGRQATLGNGMHARDVFPKSVFAKL